MASELRVIRELLLSVAKNFPIEIPRGVFRSINNAVIDPRNIKYDEGGTIEYLIQQLPTAESFRSPKWGVMCDLLGLSNTRPSINFESGDIAPGPEPTAVLSWNLEDFNVGVTMQEFSYNQNAYICSLPIGRSATFRGVSEHVVQNEMGVQHSPLWKNQHFVKEWEDTLKLILIQLGCLRSPDPYHMPASLFVTNFTGRLENLRYPSVGYRDLVFQYHMRGFRPAAPRYVSPTPGNDCVLQRIFGTIASPYGSQKLGIEERRYSVGIKTTCNLDLPVFTLITMVDRQDILDSMDRLEDETMWEAAGIRPLIRSTGVAAFAFRIRSILEYWDEDWTNLLNGIDHVLNVDVSSSSTVSTYSYLYDDSNTLARRLKLDNILSKEDRRKLMVDDDGLELSDFYFSILQLLRMAAEWIQKSVDDLSTVVNDIERWNFSVRVDMPRDMFEKLTFLPETGDAKKAMIEVFRENWESVISHQKRLATTLLGRIAKKQEEVKSLRDGLFNATSVSEVTKSSQLNHYILVFTVVTVFYLPLSFISSLFALNAFNWDDPRQIVSFSVTTILVAGTTYCFSGFLIWVVRRSERRGFIKDLFSSLNPGHLLKKGWNKIKDSPLSDVIRNMA
ncbi:hypothetical protein F4803DRAFT_549171 [Xylaria telfairii]|nr:hypothetical protein F4803DRAFT_549171 [Xylaria telfairii]